MDALFMASLWLQCPGWRPVPRLWFMLGWGLILLQTGIWGSPCTQLVDGAEWNAFMGIGGGSWSWILVCGCRRSSGRQLHLDWVVVTDCQGLEEGKRWEMFSQLLTPCYAAGACRAVHFPARTFCLLEGAHCPQPQDMTHKALRERCPGVAWGGHWQGATSPPRPHVSSGASVSVMGC